DGFAGLASLTRTGRSFNWVASYNERSRSFESALGYIDRVDFRRTDQLATYRWFRRNSSLIDLGPDLSGFVIQDRKGETLEYQARPAIYFEWTHLTQLQFYRQQASTKLRRSEFDLFDPRAELSPAYSQNGWGLNFNSQPSTSLSIGITASR